MPHSNKQHIPPSRPGKRRGQIAIDGDSGAVGRWEWNGRRWIDATIEQAGAVVRNLGRAIQSGGGPSENALIQLGKISGPVTVMNDGTRVTSTGIVDSLNNPINKNELQDVIPKTINTYNTPDNTIQLNIKSLPIGGTVVVNGNDTKHTTNNPIIFNGKELLTPKTITVTKGNRKSKDRYRVYTVEQTITKDVRPLINFDEFELLPVNPDTQTFNINNDGSQYLGFQKVESTQLNPRPLAVGTIDFKFYQLRVEKNGKEINVNNQINEITSTINKSFSVDLNFKLTEDIIIDTPTPTLYSLEIESNIGNDGDIKYSTSWGEVGFLEDEGLLTLNHKPPSIPGDTLYVDFFANGITDLSHTVSYEIQKPTNKSIQTIDSLETRVKLESGITKIIVNSVKIPKDDVKKPLLNVSIDNLKFNIKSKEDTKIVYNTSNTDTVVYTLGKTTRTLKPNGTIILNKDDFYNGIGNYIIYLQPNSKTAGSGDVKRININVLSSEYLPGPDITHINYPQNIKGADFKGFDVPFNISWQSINTNFIYVYAGKYSKDTKSNFLGKFEPNGNAKFKVLDVIKASKTNINETSDVVQFSLNLVPYNIEGNEKTEGKIEVINITFDKGDLTLPREIVINDIKESFRRQFDKRIFEDVSPFLTHYLHLGGGNNKLIATWDVDKNTLSSFVDDLETNTTKKTKEVKSLVLKLYEPLPQDISLNHKIWISKIQSIPIIDTITIIDGETAECTPLSPNFNLDVGDDIGYQILDDLIGSGSTTSTDVVNQFISSSDFDLSKLNISYVTSSTEVVESESGKIKQDTGVHGYNWPAFVKYSSAEERGANFLYKVKLIESYESKYNSLLSGSASTGSIDIKNEKDKTLTKINDVKKGLDSFEKFLYTSSSISDITYPGAGGNALSASSDSTVTSWYLGLQTSAENYDYNNKSRFVNNLPQHIQEDNQGAEFTLFFDMIGQHFDNIWAHIEGISKSNKVENKYNTGIINDLVYHMLESLGWDADMGVKSQLLWEYAFGKHSDGTVVSNTSGKDRQHEIWRRILNNLPYLNKHKGTKRALHAALSIYGIPQSLLTVMEFGGPKDPTTGGTTKFTFEDRTAAIGINSSSSITIPWKKYNSDYSNDYPNSVEITLNTNEKQDQQIISASNWSLDILSEDTGSLATIQLTVGAESASTNPMPIFNDEYTQIVVNRVSGSSSDTFELFAKEGIQGRIRNEMSASLSSTTKAWTSGSEFKIGGNTLTASIDEVRLWRTALSEVNINNHTLLPDAIDGNHISASTTDLIFRNDFEYPKNRHTSGDADIKNVALVTTYCTSSVASGFENIGDYPYQYIPYDRDVTADVPSSGFNVGNKIRFETQTTISDLTYKSRATKKSFDNAPIDSNRLGLFFSPIKEINMDILKSLGGFDIGNYIGNPADDYSDEYSDLKTLRNYYFDRYSLDINQYIQLVRYIDKSLFDVLESLVPARAKVSSGLLIEPHILERSKVELRPTTASLHGYESSIDTRENIIINSSNEVIESLLTASADISLSGTNDNYLTIISASDNHNVTGTNNGYMGTISQSDNLVATGIITRNSGSDMGGISFTVNAQFSQLVQGEYDSTAYQQIGMGPDSLSVLGFGLYGTDGNTIRTRLDKNNNFVKERIKVFLLKESYTEDVPQNINSADSSLGTELVTVTKFKHKVNILPFTGSNGSESINPVVTGSIVEVTPLDGYFPTHYRNIGDLTSGMENSFFNGSKQTASTTLDGGSPVQTFTTNPNTLRVSDSQRGSGEPILEVD